MSCHIEIREDGDIPFIEEEVRLPPSPANMGEPFRVTPSSSRSSSFNCNTPLGIQDACCQHAFLNKVDDRKDLYSFHRKSSSRRSCHSQAPSKGRRHSSFSGTKGSSRRSSTRSRRESKFSYISVGEWDDRRRSVHISRDRRHSSTRHRSIAKKVSLEQQTKSKKRKMVACVIVGTFLFILLCSVMAVVVTLTHRSKFTTENETMTYYTFSPDAKVIVLENKDLEGVNIR